MDWKTGFKTELDVRFLSDSEAELLEDLVYESKVAETVFTVPKGFHTDFASVPRAPVAYWLVGNTAHKPAVVHDWLYRTGAVPRDLADAVFCEAMQAVGIIAWRRYAMYLGVRAGGWTAYGAKPGAAPEPMKQTEAIGVVDD